jgi:hypothetical protein
MARYMFEFSYTADAWAALVCKPSDRSAAGSATRPRLAARSSA